MTLDIFVIMATVAVAYRQALFAAVHVYFVSFGAGEDVAITSPATHSVCLDPSIVDHCWQLTPPRVDEPV